MHYIPACVCVPLSTCLQRVWRVCLQSDALQQQLNVYARLRFDSLTSQTAGGTRGFPLLAIGAVHARHSRGLRHLRGCS